MSTATRSIREQEKPCKAPDRTVPMGKENPIVFHIEVDPDDQTSIVSLTPSVVMFIHGDFVKFTSNSAAAAILYTEYSPFDGPFVGKAFKVGKASKPLKVVRPRGSSHFDCGRIDEDGDFYAWPGGGGDGPGGY